MPGTLSSSVRDQRATRHRTWCGQELHRVTLGNGCGRHYQEEGQENGGVFEAYPETEEEEEEERREADARGRTHSCLGKQEKILGDICLSLPAARME